MNIYNITSEDKKTCLLPWVGSETYALLQNLFGDKHAADKSLEEMIGKISLHFKDTVHI